MDGLQAGEEAWWAKVQLSPGAGQATAAATTVDACDEHSAVTGSNKYPSKDKGAKETHVVERSAGSLWELGTRRALWIE